jgi:hypothetical protein
MITLAGGDWGLAALMRRAARRENPKILLTLSKTNHALRAKACRAPA